MKIRKLPGNLRQSAEAGFTIIESLAAIIIVTILMVGITPVLGIAVATRVQARRVELGQQAARTYIDYLRSETDTNNHPTPSSTLPSAAPAPTAGAFNCNNNHRAYCTVPAGRQLYCVDGDGDGSCKPDSVADMVVQGVAFNPTTGATPADGYRLLARVYRADAFGDAIALQTGTQQAAFTGGSGNRKAPVVEISTEISISGSTDYEDFCSRLNPSAARADACN
ncbi:MAG: type II secretion system protein [Oscillatoria sp. SIO1A7]|nr:type II secretion system protein [Oscillatoria sp. SIO1A7]